MFRLADNKQIGAYLKKRIEERKFPSVRQFGKACLEERNESTDDEALRKMANRLSQILKGSKGVQLEDLPVFSKLLDLSCEEILSGGTSFAVSSSHLSNYSIAMSQDQREWDAYLEREDQLILNADEYGKTVIEYALEFQNYAFLKYLMEQGIIWFVGEEERDYFPYFGAGTSIKCNGFLARNHNVLNSRMYEQKLRMEMILLAIRNGDIQMLEELHAREIPSMYAINCYSPDPFECEKYFDARLIEALTGANDGILEYFTTEFEIPDRFGRSFPFLFPFINRLIPALLKKKNDYVSWILKDAVKHNQNVLDRLRGMFETAVARRRAYYSGLMDPKWAEEEIEKGILYYLSFPDDGDAVSWGSPETRDGIVSNLVKVEASSEDVQIRRLIQEVNELYDQIRNIKPII